MTIEETIFNRYLIDENKLLECGFNSDYVYTVDILDNTFKVIVTYVDKRLQARLSTYLLMRNIPILESKEVVNLI